VSTYWFEPQVGPVGDLDEAAERLYPVCGDGQLAADDRGGTIVFSREARNATEEILSATDDTERAGLSVTGVMEDLVTVEDIAEKTGRSGQAVGHWSAVNADLAAAPLRWFIADGLRHTTHPNPPRVARSRRSLRARRSLRRFLHDRAGRSYRIWLPMTYAALASGDATVRSSGGRALWDIHLGGLRYVL
jgi:hypothetical protein